VLQAEYLEREAGREVASNELLGITEDLGDIIKNYKPTSLVDENTIPKEVLNDVFGDSKDISLEPENLNDVFGSTSQASSKTKVQNSNSSGRKNCNNLAFGGRKPQNKTKNLTFIKEGTNLKVNGFKTKSKNSSSGLNVGSSVSKFSSKPSSKSMASQSKKSKASQSKKSKGSQSKKSKGSQSKKSKGSQSKKSKGSKSKQKKSSQSNKSKGSESNKSKGSQSKKLSGSNKSRGSESRKSSQSEKSSSKQNISGKGSEKGKRKDLPRKKN
jgi:hypothetical protein